jgi:hypothetical protein
MDFTTISIEALDRVDVDHIASELDARLNQPGYTPVEVSAARNVLSFRGQVWTPILRVRVEDALEGLLGATWRGRFEWSH